jgi:uncharacterized protein with HEPN domain
MRRDGNLYLRDILEAIGKVERYVGDVGFEGFNADEQLVDAVVRNLEIIGEAAKNVPTSVKTAHTEVEWAKVAGFRDVLAHAYFHVDLEIAWDIVENKLPLLKKQVKKILSDDE